MQQIKKIKQSFDANDEVALYLFNVAYKYLGETLQSLIKYRYIDQDQAWELVFGKFIPHIKNFLKDQYSSVYERKMFLDQNFKFYKSIQLDPNIHQKTIYYRLYQKLDTIQNSIITKLSKNEVFELMISFFEAFTKYIIRLHNQIQESIIARDANGKYLYELFTGHHFDRFQEVINEIKVENTFKQIKKYTKQNMKIIKLKFADKKQYDIFKRFEINQFFLFYQEWYLNFNRFTKVFLPTPDELFANDIVMTLFNIYLKSDNTYLACNVLCSDEMIQVLCELLRIIGSQMHYDVIPIDQLKLSKA